MPAFAAACRIGRAVGSVGDTNPVVIIATAVPFVRIVSSARGRSSVTFSGSTCPPGRTVRSIASYPMSITAAARSLTLRSERCFEKKQKRGPPAPAAADASAATEASAPEEVLATAENGRCASKFDQFASCQHDALPRDCYDYDMPSSAHGLRYAFVSILFASSSLTTRSCFASHFKERPRRVEMLPR